MTALIDSEEAKMKTSYTCRLTELVRGGEGHLIDELSPIVRRQTVSLDFRSVERIDAAGIAALISLYRTAHDAGHGFCLANVAPRVHELLRLVGLDGLLESHNAKSPCPSAPDLVQSAA